MEGRRRWEQLAWGFRVVFCVNRAWHGLAFLILFISSLSPCSSTLSRRVDGCLQDVRWHACGCGGLPEVGR